MRVEPIGLSTSSLYIPTIGKSAEVLAMERVNRKARKNEERFQERENTIRRMFPNWLGKNVNILV